MAIDAITKKGYDIRNRTIGERKTKLTNLPPTDKDNPSIDVEEQLSFARYWLIQSLSEIFKNNSDNACQLIEDAIATIDVVIKEVKNDST